MVIAVLGNGKGRAVGSCIGHLITSAGYRTLVEMMIAPMGLLGVARANTAVGVSPETFLLLLLLLLLLPSDCEARITCQHLIATLREFPFNLSRDVKSVFFFAGM
jgi:hypothetical protein